MKALAALAAKAWSAIGDDRFGLLLAGTTLPIAIRDFANGDWPVAVFGVALGVVIGSMAWREIGKAARQ